MYPASGLATKSTARDVFWVRHAAQGDAVQEPLGKCWVIETVLGQARDGEGGRDGVDAYPVGSEIEREGSAPVR